MPILFHPARARATRRLILAAVLGTAVIPALGQAGGDRESAAPPAPATGTASGGVVPEGPPAASRPPADDEAAGTEEWMAVSRTIAAMSPNKWAMYESLPPDGNLKRQLRQQLVQRFRALQRMQQNDPERHGLEARAIWVEDEIYGVLRRLDAAVKSGEDVETHEAALRVKIDELVQNRDKWKVKRLERVVRELRSIGGPNLDRAIKPIEDEIARVQELSPDGRKPRVENRVKEFKQKMTANPLPPHLSRPLPGGDRRPANPGVPGGRAEPVTSPDGPSNP